MGGIRTFSLVGLLGCLAAYLEAMFSQGILLVILAAVIVLTAIQYFISFSKNNERGITTEISIIICFIVGILVQRKLVIQATFITVMVTVVLYLREYITKLNRKIESEDIRAVIKFTIITFVILPLFDPNFAVYVKDLGLSIFNKFPALQKIEVFRPYTVWMMVVLISGIGFIGYLAIKILGSRKGIGLTGFLGGLVSSTATTVTFSKRSKSNAILSMSFALAVLLACSTMFPRILVEVAIVNPKLLPSLSVTISLMAVAGFIFCFILWKKTKKEISDEVPLVNPFEILPAVKFGLLYAAIVFVSRLVSETAGSNGVYIVSILSGLTDVDAITLSMSQIAKTDPSKMGQASIAITLAAFSNTIMKAGMAIFLGAKKFRIYIVAGFSGILIFGVIGLFILKIAF